MALELLVDAGNSRVKWLPVVDGIPQWDDYGGCMHAELASAWPVTGRIQRTWVASVAPSKFTGTLTRFLSERSERVEQVVTGSPEGPVAAAYPGLGVDRWLTLQAVWRETRRAGVIADCGSALTIDLVDDRGVHRGGWITAGFQAARAGLTARVPALPGFELDAASSTAQPAVDTPTQIARGLRLQQAAMIERAWRACCLVLGTPLSLMLTGGDAGDVQSVLEVPSRRDDALVLKGLMVISGDS